MIDRDKLRSRLDADDHRRLLERCGFDIDGKRGPHLSGILGPKELGEGKEGNFSVDLEQGVVNDFGSSEYGGDVFDVVMDVRGLDFLEAVEWIINELNLDLSTPQPEVPKQGSNTPSEASTSNEAQPEAVVSHDEVRRWHERLMSDTEAAEAARSYLIEERGVDEDVLQTERIGLAHTPNDHRARWWVMIPVPHRTGGDTPPITAVKGFAFDPSAREWKRNDNGRKIPRNAGSAALYALVPSNPKESPVVVCEGEIDALCAVSHEFNAVTGTAGAGTFKDEWATYIAGLAPAQEHGVVVAFDGDDTGRKYAPHVAATLYEAGLDVQIASLPDGQDVNDVLVSGGSADLDAYLVQAEPYTASEETQAAVETEEMQDDSDLSYKPFPLEALPDRIAAYVSASTRALGKEIPHAMVAIPTLSVLSGAIGDAARVELKSSWVEPAPLWTVLVAPSGSTKTPAFLQALRPVFRREKEARDKYEKALADWKAQEDPDERDKPTRRRFRTGDATPEAVVKILEENPRGVLLARDELAAWIGSFDRYVNGAADLQFWAEVWGGMQASRDRASEGNTTVHHPAVPVTGTIQPGTLKEKLDDIHFDTGFAARLILCMPPTKPKRWTEADVSREVRDGYERLLTRLYKTPRGTTVSLSSKAKKQWIEYYDEANASMEARPEGPAKRVAAKGITHTARLALILHLCRQESAKTQSAKLDSESMEAALRIGRWLTRETLRVYQQLSLDAEAVPPIRRFLHRLPDQFETADAKQIAEDDEIPRRTLFDWLDKLQESGDLEKVKRGVYRKT